MTFSALNNPQISFFQLDSAGGSNIRGGGSYVTSNAPRPARIGTYVTTNAPRPSSAGTYVTSQAQTNRRAGSYVDSDLGD